ncbi:hypothetical protein ASF41_22215 [Methylobacterium sp. Leaf111]|nr:hypothetical protein ASF41_22215 [Methylobacterium sp. Leaf111]
MFQIRTDPILGRVISAIGASAVAILKVSTFCLVCMIIPALFVAAGIQTAMEDKIEIPVPQDQSLEDKQ